MSQKSILSLKHDLLDFADNITTESFSTLSSGVGLGDLVVKSERKIVGASAKIQKENILDVKESKQEIQPTNSESAIDTGDERLAARSMEKVDLSEIQERNYKVRRSTKIKKSSSIGNRQRITFSFEFLGRYRSLVAHLIDLSVASVGFLAIFVTMLGAEANWDKDFLYSVIADLGVAYIALFSYGAFILYHFVFRMLRIPRLGKIIVGSKKEASPLSRKAKTHI